MSTPRRRALSKLAILLLIAATLFGCARRLVGSPIQEDNIPKITIGKTTHAEVLRLFGSPYQIESQGDMQVITYLYGEDFTWSLILYREQRMKADVLRVFIDKEGIVRDYSFSRGVAVPDLYKRPALAP